MITHNKPLDEQLKELIYVVSAKAHDFEDSELLQLLEDLVWIEKSGVISVETEQDYTYEEAYDKGFEDGYEDAKESVLNAL